MSQLGYSVNVEDLDITTLKAQKAIPSEVSPRKVLRICANDYVEVVVLDFDQEGRMTRSACTRTARSWKENRLTKPVLLFTNGKDSFAVIVTGKGTGGEAKILRLSDRMYKTDLDVVESMAHPGTDEELRRNYDTVFFPYEKVRSEFFEGYRDIYQRIDKIVEKRLGGKSASYAQRFLGRLMFLYFLQRKGWLNSDKRFLDTLRGYKELNNLFYKSLNTGGTHGIPFLNGSLFEKEEFMDEEMENLLCDDMDVMFKKARTFFDQYNFTVDELAPLEVDVSIDPALIGTVFENMLPEYERGSRGTFYTPRSESSFICRRALANYFGCKDKISSNGKNFGDGLALYIDKLRKSKSEKEVMEFREKLLSIRVMDPAVGSGGFLLVMMQEIIGLVQEAEVIVGWRSDPEEYKKKILPNLYGFDIEPEAIEIARLRLWLSLIIDQKEPEPLPNLDMNLIKINDSLRRSVTQTTLDPEVEELREKLNRLKTMYLNEHEARKKTRLREQLQNCSSELARRTGEDPNVIEFHLQPLADIVVMNPPYVRQEAIPEKSKSYYTSKYELGKKSDLYAYFLVRSLQLLSADGVMAVISSDKWLETGYGVSLQRKLKDNSIAIYGQRERSFGADINTVITVYSAGKQNLPVHFTYLESYAGNEIRQDIAIDRKDLKPGKWFYLRAPKIFIEKMLPKLTYKLSDFAEIRFGIKTGANDFFCIKDVSHLYEANYLTNPKKFETGGIDCRTAEDLRRKGLIYIENEGGERFVIDVKDVAPMIRSPTELDSYVIKRTPSLIFKPNPPHRPGPHSALYIRWGEEKTIEVTKGKDAGKKLKGYHKLSSTIGHRPFWFNVPELPPARVISHKFFHDRHFVSFSPASVLADHTCDLIYPRVIDGRTLWLAMNSTIFYLAKELFGLRMGGAALQILTGDYNEIPIPDLRPIRFDDTLATSFDRKPLRYRDELEQSDRKELDLTLLTAMGFSEPRKLLPQIYEAFVEVVGDRLIKAGRHLAKDDEQASQSGRLTANDY